MMERFLNQKLVKHSVPFLVFIGIGYMGLNEFADIRYKFSKENMMVCREEATKRGIEMKPPHEVTLESEYEKIKQLNTDDWDNVRIPRPWEEGPSNQQSNQS